jgi:hypothetical protein
MKSALHLLCAFAAASAMASPALAENCADTTFSTLAATSCLGSFSGNINGSQSELDDLETEFGTEFTYLGKSDDPMSGPFTGNPQVNEDGTLTFDAPMTGSFVIGLKAANNYSYYLFNAGALVSSLTFNDTDGVAVNRRGVAQDLSHANLYAAVTAVPEPETYALFLAGLGFVSFIAKRRKAA